MTWNFADALSEEVLKAWRSFVDEWIEAMEDTRPAGARHEGGISQTDPSTPADVLELGEKRSGSPGE